MKPRYYHSLYINKKINKRIKTTPPQQTHLNKKKKKKKKNQLNNFDTIDWRKKEKKKLTSRALSNYACN